MLIVSQNKEVTTESLELRIDCTTREKGEFPNIKIEIIGYCVVDKKHDTFLGKYKTEERAKEVLQEIIAAYKNEGLRKIDTIMIDEKVVFEMPIE